MREILFRGKTQYKSRWVEGFYYLKKGKYAECNDILFEHHKITTGIEESYGSYGEHSEDIEYDVFPETVGQYTGLTDKNGKKIFEGDIVEFQEEYGCIEYHDKEAKFVVKYDAGICDFDHIPVNEVEVIGNIHDNPELLKGGAE